MQTATCRHENMFLDSKQGNYVCMDCGTVTDDFITDNDIVTHGLGYQHASKYKRLYHFNERLSQLSLRESSIPKNDMEKIAEAASSELGKRIAISPEKTKDLSLYRERVRGIIDKSFIQQILKMAGGVDFTKKYLEKWLSIRLRLLGERPPELDHDDLERCRLNFVAIEQAFYHVRGSWHVRVYSPPSDSNRVVTLDRWIKKKDDSAKSKASLNYKVFQYRKRQHILNLNYVLRFILIKIDRQDLLPFLPMMKDTRKLREHEKIMAQICAINDWDFHSVLYSADIKDYLSQ